MIDCRIIEGAWKSIDI